MNDKNLENGKATQFQKGQSGNPAGRKPNIYKRIQSEYDLSKQDHENIIEDLMKLSSEKLTAIRKNKKNPALIMAYAGVVLKAVKDGDIRQLNLLADRVYGKPTQALEHSGGIQLKTLTEAESKALET